MPVQAPILNLLPRLGPSPSTPHPTPSTPIPSPQIYDVLCAKGWEETDSEHDWDIHWAEREWVYEVFDQMHLESHQRLNHFRNAKEICRKDLLIKNLKKRKRQLEKEGQYEEATQYDFFPVTFNLPREYALFVEEVSSDASTMD